MHINLKKSAIEDAIKIIADDLAAIQSTLEELYRSVEEQFSNQAISNDIEAMKAVVNEVSRAANEAENPTTVSYSERSQKFVSLFRQFQELLDQFRSKYRDLISSKTYRRLQHETLEIEINVRFMIAVDHLFPIENFQNHYKGMLLLSEALEYGISLSENYNFSFFLENDWLESSKNIAMAALNKLEALEVSKQLPASQDNVEKLQGVITYKNAARSILWQIDKFEEAASSSNRDLTNEEELKLVEEGNQALLAALAIRWQRIESEANAEDHV